MELKEIKKLAKKHKYKLIAHDKDSFMLSFYNKEKIRINVYYTTMTVGTCLEHPKKGKTQLFRKKVNLSQLAKIFENPRTHTDKGYYTKYREYYEWNGIKIT